MDDYYFENHVRACKVVNENTSFLQIYNFSDGEVYFDKGTLPTSEFRNFLMRQGVFAPPKTKPGVEVLSTMRLILQLDASDKDTFSTGYISLKHDEYIDMVRQLALPFRGIESSSVVGPFFWSAMDLDDANPHLQMVFRKSDVLKRGKSRGWELMLSHELRTATTTGYAKGTETSQMDQIIREHLQACAVHVAHPMLLPAIVLGHHLDHTMDDKQRVSRQSLRRLEHAITDRNEIDPTERYLDMDLYGMNKNLIECYSQVLWKRPQAFLDTIDEIEVAMARFHEVRAQLRLNSQLPDRHTDPAFETALLKLNRSLKSRFSFFRQKLKGIRHYAHTTITRLDIQQNSLHNAIAQADSKLNLEMSHQQRLLSLAAKRDSQSMKALAVVGAVFLPATYLASVFSMTFFNFQADGGSQTVAPSLWVYFAITLPVTAAVLGLLLYWDRSREKAYTDEEKKITEMRPMMERSVLEQFQLRRTGFNSLGTMRLDSI